MPKIRRDYFLKVVGNGKKSTEEKKRRKERKKERKKGETTCFN